MLPFHISQRGEAHVRRFAHSSLRSYPGRDQDRKPVFLCLPLQEGTDKIHIQLKQKTGAQGNTYSASQSGPGPRLIYVYRPHALENDLTDHQARELLLRYGYTPENLNACVMHLIHRLQSAEEFPHEIGLFLSYPPNDVLGFIDNNACNHKCQGCWKVYGNEQESKSTFKKYDLCSKIYFQQWKQRKSIEQLTVAG